MADKVHSQCLGFHSLISDLNISTSRWSLSSSGPIFHTLQYRKEFQQKWVILTQLTEKSV